MDQKLYVCFLDGSRKNFIPLYEPNKVLLNENFFQLEKLAKDIRDIIGFELDLENLLPEPLVDLYMANTKEEDKKYDLTLYYSPIIEKLVERKAIFYILKKLCDANTQEERQWVADLLIDKENKPIEDSKKRFITLSRVTVNENILLDNFRTCFLRYNDNLHEFEKMKKDIDAIGDIYTIPFDAEMWTPLSNRMIFNYRRPLLGPEVLRINPPKFVIDGKINYRAAVEKIKKERRSDFVLELLTKGKICHFFNTPDNIKFCNL